MTSDATGQAAEAQGLRFPYLRRRGPIALIGLSTALPTPPLLATGTLGDAQLNMLDRLLHRLGEERCFRVVLLHHPPLAPAAHWRKNLTDAPALRDVIAEHGAELVLHGHNHRLELAELDSRVGPVPVVGVPSASAVQSGKHPESHYQICGIVPADAGWRLSFRLRRFDPLGSAFTEGPARQVTLPRRYAN